MINFNLRINCMVKRGPTWVSRGGRWREAPRGEGDDEPQEFENIVQEIIYSDGKNINWKLGNRSLKDKSLGDTVLKPPPPFQAPCNAPILKPICRLTNDFDGPGDKMFFENNLFFFIAGRESLPTILNVVLPDLNVAKKLPFTQIGDDFFPPMKSL